MMEILAVENTLYATSRKIVLEDLKMFSLSLDRKRAYKLTASKTVCVLFSAESTVRMAPQSIP